MIYTGIGSRNAPDDVLTLIKKIASVLDAQGYILRSGSAEGCDSAFESGSSRSEIYLPWRDFRGNKSRYDSPTLEAIELAQKYHPAWSGLSAPVKKLMGRNSHQVLGYNLETPSKFVVCWTPDGCESGSSRTRTTGGTGQAISIASAYSVPVFNLRNESALDRLSRFIGVDFEYPNENDLSSSFAE